jgi:hypothetical protein
VRLSEYAGGPGAAPETPATVSKDRPSRRQFRMATLRTRNALIRFESEWLPITALEIDRGHGDGVGTSLRKIMHINASFLNWFCKAAARNGVALLAYVNGPLFILRLTNFDGLFRCDYVFVPSMANC